MKQGFRRFIREIHKATGLAAGKVGALLGLKPGARSPSHEVPQATSAGAGPVKGQPGGPGAGSARPGWKRPILKISKATGLSVGEICSALGIPLYDQRLAQGLKRGECSPTHKVPRAAAMRSRPRKGAPGTYRAIFEALGQGSVVNVESIRAPVPFARRTAIHARRIAEAARRQVRTA